MASCFTPDIVYQALISSPLISEKCELILSSAVQPTRFNLYEYLSAFGLTCLLELPFYFLCCRHRSPLKRLQILVLANLASHPLIYFALPALLAQFGFSIKIYLLIAETTAPLLEALLLWRLWSLSLQIAIPVTIAANLFSWAFGLYLLH